jgi:hypothetical protein
MWPERRIRASVVVSVLVLGVLPARAAASLVVGERFFYVDERGGLGHADFYYRSDDPSRMLFLSGGLGGGRVYSNPHSDAGLSMSVSDESLTFRGSFIEWADPLFPYSGVERFTLSFHDTTGTSFTSGVPPAAGELEALFDQGKITGYYYYLYNLQGFLGSITDVVSIEPTSEIESMLPEPPTLPLGLLGFLALLWTAGREARSRRTSVRQGGLPSGCPPRRGQPPASPSCQGG